MIYLQIVRGIIFAQGLLRIVIAVLFAIHTTQSQAVIPVTIMLGLSALIFIFLAWLLGKKTRISLYIVLVVLILDIFVTVFDQLGWWDIANMGVDVVAVMLLVAIKDLFKPSPRS